MPTQSTWSCKRCACTRNSGSRRTAGNTRSPPARAWTNRGAKRRSGGDNPRRHTVRGSDRETNGTRTRARVAVPSSSWNGAGWVSPGLVRPAFSRTCMRAASSGTLLRDGPPGATNATSTCTLLCSSFLSFCPFARAFGFTPRKTMMMGSRWHFDYWHKST